MFVTLFNRLALTAAKFHLLITPNANTTGNPGKVCFSHGTVRSHEGVPVPREQEDASSLSKWQTLNKLRCFSPSSDVSTRSRAWYRA